MHEETMNPEKTDRELVQEISEQRSEGAYQILFERYQLLVLRILRHHVQNKEDVDDLFQNFWLLVWEKPTVLVSNEEGSVRPAVFAQLRYKVLDLYRASLRSLVVNMDMEELESSAIVDDLIAACAEASDNAELMELLEIVAGCFSARRQRAKEIFMLRLKNYSVDEVAQMLNMSRRTVYNSFSESRLQVQQFLMHHYPEYDWPNKIMPSSTDDG